jgi:enediyne biosynthesis protein E4
VLGGTLKDARHLEATTLDHEIFFNRGGAFEAKPLPPEAQFAPAFYAGVADFDGDGHEDLFLAQNFFPTEIGTPRYDAGRGLLLRGRGDGALEPVPGQVSGIMVYGDQRGAAFADYDGDGRVDLVVSQNGAETKLYHNEHARPGVRVRLSGGPLNPRAIGAVLRLVYEDSRGPAREVHGGSGYWSEDGAIQVLGLAEGQRATGVWVRWPGGRETVMPLALGQLEITIRQPKP